MITINDYLKPIKMMTEQEKEVYFDRVKRWTEEDYPRLCAVQEAWTASDIKSFDEGCTLISVLQGARQWLPSKIYQKDIKRRLTWVRDWLDEINRRYGKVDFAAMPHPNEAVGRAIYVAAKAERSKSYATVVKEQADAAVADGKIPATATARPKHLDAYLHLLPVKVQEDAAQLSALYLKLGEFHQMLHKIADDPRANPKDREKYAKAVTKAADTIDAIYAEVEAAWEALSDADKAKAGVPVAEVKPAAEESVPSGLPAKDESAAEEDANTRHTEPEATETPAKEEAEPTSEEPATEAHPKKSTTKKSAAKKTTPKKTTKKSE